MEIEIGWKLMVAILVSVAIMFQKKWTDRSRRLFRVLSKEVA